MFLSEINVQLQKVQHLALFLLGICLSQEDTFYLRKHCCFVFFLTLLIFIWSINCLCSNNQISSSRSSMLFLEATPFGKWKLTHTDLIETYCFNKNKGKLFTLQNRACPCCRLNRCVFFNYEKHFPSFWRPLKCIYVVITYCTMPYYVHVTKRPTHYIYVMFTEKPATVLLIWQLNSIKKAQQPHSYKCETLLATCCIYSSKWVGNVSSNFTVQSAQYKNSDSCEQTGHTFC